MHSFITGNIVEFKPLKSYEDAPVNLKDSFVCSVFDNHIHGKENAKCNQCVEYAILKCVLLLLTHQNALILWISMALPFDKCNEKTCAWIFLIGRN